MKNCSSKVLCSNGADLLLRRPAFLFAGLSYRRILNVYLRNSL